MLSLGRTASYRWAALQARVQILNHFNPDQDRQHSTPLTAQVFLAYAAADRSDPKDPGSGRGVSPAAATVNALRQLIAEAQIGCWECSRPETAMANPEAVISRATEACDNYLLVLTPRSMVDVGCLQGLLFALSMNKRIVPVLAEAVPSTRLPEPLQTLEIIDFRTLAPPLGRTHPGRKLVQTLHHDASFHQAHTQLLVKALQWERQLRDPGLLLRGKELAGYQRWLAGATQRSRYRPIQLQSLYVAESARQGGDREDIITQGTGWLKRWLE